MATKTVGRNERGDIVYQENDCGCIWQNGTMDFCQQHDPFPVGYCRQHRVWNACNPMACTMQDAPPNQR